MTFWIMKYISGLQLVILWMAPISNLFYICSKRVYLCILLRKWKNLSQHDGIQKAAFQAC